MNNPLSDKRIIDSLRTHYGVKVISLTFLPLGADANASVYRAETQEQQSYFVKIKKGHHDSSITMMDLLHRSGVEQIIPPIQTLQDQPSLQIEDSTVIVYPFIEGQDGFTRSLSEHQWRALGKTLRRIHDIDVPLSLQLNIRRETYSPKWRKVVRQLLSHEETDHVDEEIAAKLWAFIKENLAAKEAH